MNCPICDEEMTLGQVEIHGTALGFLIMGLSHQPLFFSPPNEPEKQLLKPNKTYDAFCCDFCKTVTILYEKPNVLSRKHD